MGQIANQMVLELFFQNEGNMERKKSGKEKANGLSGT